MQTAFRPMGWDEKWLFALCVVASAVVHAAVAWMALPDRREAVPDSRALGERVARAVNGATGLDERRKARADEVLARMDPGRWTRTEMAQTLQWAASDLEMPVQDSDVVRALDPERSREGRWDIRVWMAWGEGAGLDGVLTVAYLVGEGTLKSDFGSHRLWVHLEAPDGSGRLAFETMDCRLYRAGKLSGPDLLHRATWFDR